MKTNRVNEHIGSAMGNVEVETSPFLHVYVDDVFPE